LHRENPLLRRRGASSAEIAMMPGDSQPDSNGANAMEWASSREPTQSVFVTAVAWIFIALDGAASFVLLIENLLINTFVPFDELREGMAHAKHAVPLPPYFAWSFEHIRPILLAVLIYTLVKLAAAIGLLKRQNWARLVFMGILAFGIVWTFAAIVLQQYALSSMLTMPIPPNAPRDFEADMQSMMNVMRIVMAIFAIAFAVLYAWMIKKLLSPAIAAEFKPR
jgi:small-conductance mechanosensitive channel